MKKRKITEARLLDVLSFEGLSFAPMQNWRSVTVMPLLRKTPCDGLRLDMGKGQLDEGVCTYTPHGMVMSWGADGSGDIAWETKMRVGMEGGSSKQYGRTKQVSNLSGMIQRTYGEDRLHFLPMSMAIESYMALFSERPKIASRVFSQEVIRQGLRREGVHGIQGASILGLEEALGMFEVHEQQCGMLLMLNGKLASAFVVPSHQDYMAMHDCILMDIFGEMFRNLLGQPFEDVSALTLDMDKIKTLKDLNEAYEAARTLWSSIQVMWADELLEKKVDTTIVYQAGQFSMQRFISPLINGQDGHVGEAIVREDGVLAYLKTFRLNRRQVRRGRLVQGLAQHNWQLAATARTLGYQSVPHLKDELGRMGLGYIFR